MLSTSCGRDLHADVRTEHNRPKKSDGSSPASRGEEVNKKLPREKMNRKVPLEIKPERSPEETQAKIKKKRNLRNHADAGVSTTVKMSTRKKQPAVGGK